MRRILPVLVTGLLAFINFAAYSQCGPGAYTPTANPNSFTTGRNSALAISSAQLLANDAAAPSGTGPLVISSFTQPSSGSLTQDASGNFVFTPNAGFEGTVTFTYTIKHNDNVKAFADNGHYYEYISGAQTWTNAKALAAGRTYFGMQGYLATVTTFAENEFIKTKLSGDGWIGASDLAVEGTWRWVTGPEGLENAGAGRIFSTQNKLFGNNCSANIGTAVGGNFVGWANGEPNDCGSFNTNGNTNPSRAGEHVAHFYGSGVWNDFPDGAGVAGYVVEYGGLEACLTQLTSTATVTISVNPPAGALRFSKLSSDYVRIPNPFTGFNKEITVEWSAIIDNTSNIGTGLSQSTENVDGAGSMVWMMHYYPTANEIQFYVSDAGVWKSVVATVPPGWHHFVGVASAANMRMYMDGALIQTSANNITTGILNVPGATMSMGKDNRYATGRYFDGQIDNVRIWSRALCADEINYNKSCSFTGPQNGLEASYDFNTGVAAGENAGLTTLTDVSGKGRHGTLINFDLTGSTSNWVLGTTAGFCAVYAPVVNITSGSTVFCQGSNMVLSASTTISGGTYQWQLNGANIPGATSSTYTATTGGAYSVNVLQSGGCSTPSNVINLTMNVAPVITPISNISVTSGAGICGANVTFGTTATGIPAPSLTYSIPSGSLFAVGTTPVIITASNSCATVTSNFTVTVTDNVAPTLTLNSANGALTALGTINTYNTLVGASGSLLHAHGIAYDLQRNTVWVTDQDLGNKLLEFPATQPGGSTLSPLTQFAPAIGTTIEGVAFDATDNTLWVAGFNGIVLHIDRSNNILPGGFNVNATIPAGTFGAVALGIGIQDNFIWIDNGVRAYKFNKSGGGYTGFSFATGQPGITYDPERHVLWTSGWNDGRYRAYDPATGAVVFTSANMGIVQGHDLSIGAGRIWVATENASRDLIYSMDIVGGAIDQIIECHSTYTDPGYTVTDNCPNPTVTVTGSVNANLPGTYPVTYTARDNSNNTTTVTRTITVLDRTPPVPTVSSLPALTGVCGVTVTTFPTANDACGGTITATTTDPLTYGQGTYTIHWTYTDASGNTASQNQSVTVNDVTPPVITCAFNVTVPADANSCGAIVTYNKPTASDNCGSGNLPTSIPGFTYKGTFGGHTYFLSDILTTPEDAHARAILAGGHLASINSAAENTFISQMDPGYIWMGFTDRDVEGTFKWVTNEPVTYTNWAAGEPNNAGNEDWSVINWGSDKWNDWTFTSQAKFVVEFEGGTIPTTLTSGRGSGAFFPIGTTTETYRATDGAGNSVTCSFTVTVTDNQNPVIVNLPANISRGTDIGLCSAVVTWAAPTVNDNCTGATITQIAGPSSGSVFLRGITTVTYRATDASGNSVTQSFTVTVNDLQAPVPNVAVLPDVVAQCSANVPNPTATDNCSSQVSGVTNDPVFYGAQGNYVIHWRYTDQFGNTSTQNQNVIIRDNIAPTFVCPAAVTIRSCDFNIPNLIAGLNATDNCTPANNIIVSQSPNVGFLIQPATTVNVIITARDNVGNTTTCTVAVTRPDIIVSAFDLTQPRCSGGSDGVLKVNTTGGRTPYQYSINNGASFQSSNTFTNLSAATYQVLVKDADGCNAPMVNVVMNQPTPVGFNVNKGPVSCAGMSNGFITANAFGGSSGNAASTYTWNAPTDFDDAENTFPEVLNVSKFSLSGNGFAHSHGDALTIAVDLFNSVSNTWITVFTFNLSAGQQFNLAGVNTSFPTIPKVTGVRFRSNPSQFNSYHSVSGLSVTLTSNNYQYSKDGGATFQDGSTFNGLPAGTYNIVVKDVNGCTSPVQAVTVTEPAPLVASITSVTSVICPGGNNGAITINVTGGNAPYNYSWSNGATTQSVSGLPVGNYNVTVRDSKNCITNVAATVQQVDPILPTVKTKNITVSLDAMGQAYITPADVDNGSFDNCVIVSETINISQFNCSNVGNPVPVTLTVRDNSGNTSFGVAMVTVVDLMPPMVHTKTAVLVLDANGKASLTALDINDNSKDNCGIASYSLDRILFNCADVGHPVPVELTVTDIHGNSASLVQMITVLDNEHPSITAAPNQTQTNDRGDCGANVTVVPPSTHDNCAVATVTNDYTNTANASGHYPVGTTLITWTVTDVHGNSSTTTQTITVTDNENPVITAAPNQTQTNDRGDCGAMVTVVPPSTGDNCGVASVTNDYTNTADASGHYPVGTTVVKWTVTDIHGNSSSTTQSITVTDNENPVITAAPNQTQTNDRGDCGAMVTVIPPTTGDNCAVAGVTNNYTNTANASGHYPVGTTVVTWTVTDIHGNSSSTTQSITVTDNENPVITAAPNQTQTNDRGDCGAMVTVVPPTTGDNCAVAGVTNNYTNTANASGHYPVGTTVVTWTVTDTHGNSSTATQTITVTDDEHPILTAPATLEVCDNNAGNTKSFTLAATDNCAIQSVTYTITGVTGGSGNGNSVTANFNVGTSYVNWTVTDVHNNVSTATTKVIINSLPTVTLSASNADAMCNVLTLTAASSHANSSFEWIYNASTFANTQAVMLNNSNGDGVYSVYTTSDKGCRSLQPANYTYNKQNMISNYTIFASKNVKLGYRNQVNGSVGVSDVKGKLEVKKYSSVLAPYFVKAANINVDRTAIVTTQVIAPATVTLPTMQFFTGNYSGLPNSNINTNTTLNGNYKDVKIKKGAVVTITGSLFKSIEIEEGAVVTFTSPVLNIEDLHIDGGPSTGYTYVNFSNDASVRIGKQVKIDERVRFNESAKKVTLYLGDIKADEEKFMVKGRDSRITANIYVPNGKIQVEGGCYSDDNDHDCDDKHHPYGYHDHDSKENCQPTIMTGLFIGESVESNGKNVIWNSYNCGGNNTPARTITPAIVTTTPVKPTDALSLKVDEKGVPGTFAVLKVAVRPNPTTTTFVVHVETSSKEPVAIRIVDALGRIQEVKTGIIGTSDVTMGGALNQGAYFIEVTQGRNKEVVKAIKLK